MIELTVPVILTKDGELGRYKATLSNAGFSYSPRTNVDSEFNLNKWTKREEELRSLKRTIDRFKSMASPEGPFLPYLMIRNDGTPHGTGEGRSIPVAIDESEHYIAKTIQEVRESDPTTKGVIVQLFVGQPVGEKSDEKWFAPFFGGIGYTANATERGNAVMEYVSGHPNAAVKGEGEYFAFDKEDVLNGITPDFYGQGKRIDVLIDGRNSVKFNFFENDTDIRIGERDGFSDKSISINEKRAVFGKIQNALINLDDSLYLEWAATLINKQARLFALQVAEKTRKIAGLPTWMYKALQKMDTMDQDATETMPSEIENLRARYKIALEDPSVISVGFDVVGKDRRVYDELIWLPKNISVGTGGSKTTIFAFDSQSLEINSVTSTIAYYYEVGALVEIYSGRHSGTFGAHAHGFCESKDILGLGGTVEMQHKLYNLFPEEFGRFRNLGELRIKGKFVIDIDEYAPFGTLKVEKIENVERM